VLFTPNFPLHFHHFVLRVLPCVVLVGCLLKAATFADGTDEPFWPPARRKLEAPSNGMWRAVHQRILPAVRPGLRMETSTPVSISLHQCGEGKLRIEHRTLTDRHQGQSGGSPWRPAGVCRRGTRSSHRDCHPADRGNETEGLKRRRAILAGAKGPGGLCRQTLSGLTGAGK